MNIFSNKPVSFVALTYALTALYSIIFLFVPYNTQAGKFIVSSVYMFLPLIATIILQVFVYKEPLKNIGFSFKWSNWYIFAALVPFVWAALATGFSLLIPGVTFAPGMEGMFEKFKGSITPEQEALMREQMSKYPWYVFLLGSVFQALLFGITLNAVFAFGEEAGWRGFFLDSIKAQGFWKASLVTGLVWGIWHAPVILQGHNYPEHRQLGVFMMIAWTILLSPFFTYAVLKTGSAVPAAIMHGVLNASYGFSLIYIKGGNDLTVGLTGAAGLAAVAFCVACLYAYDRFYAKEKVIL